MVKGAPDTGAVGFNWHKSPEEEQVKAGDGDFIEYLCAAANEISNQAMAFADSIIRASEEELSSIDAHTREENAGVCGDVAISGAAAPIVGEINTANQADVICCRR